MQSSLSIGTCPVAPRRRICCWGGGATLLPTS